MRETNNTVIGLDIIFPMKNKSVFEFFLFTNIDLKGFYFRCVSGEMLSNNGIVKFPPVFTPTYFYTIKDQKRSICTLHCTLFPDDCRAEEIHTYNEFMISNCEMIVLFYDWQLEIYCKNKRWIDILKWNANGIPDAKVAEKTVLNDTRTEMYC